MGHYEGLPVMNIDKIIDYLEQHEKKCYNCGELIENSTFGSYAHDGGIELKGFFTTQWVYFICDKCESELALWKLLSPKDWAYLSHEELEDAKKRYIPYRNHKGDGKTINIDGEELPIL